MPDALSVGGVNEFAFRALDRGDFALLRGWLAQSHVARWWNHDTSPAAVEADFGAAVDGRLTRCAGAPSP